ncbi:MAG: SGNH/GDSL hydrolase family protein [Kiritimatiellia bacterium]
MLKKMSVVVCLLCYAFAVNAEDYEKVLFLGNSITHHGPKEEIGWEGNWGMAASSEDRDYVHCVLRALTEKSGFAPQILAKNIATFERKHVDYDTASLVSKAKEFSPDLIVVAIGENVPELETDESKALFAGKLEKLLKDIRGDNNPVILVRSCFWADKAKDNALKKVCQSVGGIYVYIGALCKDERNFARSERSFRHTGVAAHPGDRGMQAIADAIMRGLKYIDVAANEK